MEFIVVTNYETISRLMIRKEEIDYIEDARGFAKIHMKNTTTTNLTILTIDSFDDLWRKLS